MKVKIIRVLVIIGFIAVFSSVSSVIAKNENSLLVNKTTTEELFKTGINLYEQQDYLEASKYLKNAADKGHTQAQYFLGVIYENGYGTEADSELALRWWRLAAGGGDVKALHNIGVLFYEGREKIKRNYQEAYKWWSLAAEKDYALSANNLGFMRYRRGKGVKKDILKAIDYFNSTEGSKEVKALYNMAELVRTNGRLIEDHWKKAVDLYQEAAEYGNEFAMSRLGTMYKFGVGIEQDYTKAIKHLGAAANGGIASAQFELAVMYEYGLGTKQDYKKAIDLYKLADKNGYKYAHNSIMFAEYKFAEKYLEGKGVSKDHKKAFEFYKSAAERGYKKSAMKLANMYENGIGTNKDYELAYKWYEFASSRFTSICGEYHLGRLSQKGLGTKKSYYNAVDKYENAYSIRGKQLKLGFQERFDNGEIIPTDLVDALKIYKVGSEKGDNLARYYLANLYRYGWGIDKSDIEAQILFLLSAESGYVPAQLALAQLLYNKRDIEERLKSKKWFKKAADNGNAEALYFLYSVYRSGYLEEKRDEDKAIQLLKKSAEAGFIPAIYELGEKYYRGWGVEQDEDKGVEMYRMAAEYVCENKPEELSIDRTHYHKNKEFHIQLRKVFDVAKKGDKNAQYDLAQIYQNRELGANNSDNAFKWYLLAAENGHVESQFLLGEIYSEQDNISDSEKWYNQAAINGHQKAKKRLAYVSFINELDDAYLYSITDKKERSNTEKIYDNGMLALRDRKTKEAYNILLPIAVDGYVPAQYQLSKMYKYADETKWLHKVVNQSDKVTPKEFADAAYRLGLKYGDFYNDMHSDNEAARLYTLSADLGNTKAQIKLADMYFLGKHFKEDRKEAAMWYKVAAENGNPEAQVSIGKCYEFATGVKQDYKEAAKWYTKAADNGNNKAMYNLFFLYYDGKGVKKDLKKAKELIYASAKGYYKAEVLLNKLIAKDKKQWGSRK